MKDGEEYKRAERRVNERKGFYGHLTAYLITNLFLAAINLISTPEHLWFYWVAFGWGIGVLVNAISVFGFGSLFGNEWEEKKIREYMDKERLDAR